MKFKRVVSLGAHCQVAYQIERHFKVPGIGPFEWLVVPWTSLISILSDRAQSLGRAVCTISEGHAAVDANYGACLHHEFDRNAEGKVILYEDSVSRCGAKLGYKWSSMIQALEQSPVLFVRLGTFVQEPVAVVYREEEQALGHSHLNSLAAEIDALRPSLDFRILLVNYPELWRPVADDAPLDRRVDVRNFAVGRTDRWEGDDAQWDEAFNDYTLDQAHEARP